MKFIAIVGTNASFSYNRKLLWYIREHFIKTAQIEVLEITELPLFNEDETEFPDKINEISQKIMAADGVIFSTPEYDHAITAALKSLIEWLSWGAEHPLTNAPVMIVGASLGNMGTVFAQENLRQILSSPGIDAFVLPGHQFLLGRAADSFDEQGALKDENTINWLEQCFLSFKDYAEILKPLRTNAIDRIKTKANRLTLEDAATGASESEEGDFLNVETAYGEIAEALAQFESQKKRGSKVNDRD